MRAKKVTGNEGNRGMCKAVARLKAMRLLALGLCFVTVFALTMAFGSGLLGDVESTALAADKVVGALVAQQGDHGDASGYDFQFPGSSGNATTWGTFTETFSKTKSTYHVRKTDEKTDALLTMPENETGTWRILYESADNPNSAILTMHYQLPSLIVQLLSNPGFSVTIDYSLNLTGHAIQTGYLIGSNGKVYWACEPVDTIAEGTDSSTVNGGSKTSGWSKAEDSTDHKESVSKTAIALKSTNNYLRFTFTMYPKQRQGKTRRELIVSDLKITFHISYSRTVLNKNSVFEDGGAPVWANDYGCWIGTRDFTEPYRDEYKDYSGTNNKWNVWKDEIAGSDNRNYTLDRENRYVSYAGKSLGTYNQIPYYKHTSLTAIDSYNYYNQSSFADAMSDSTTSIDLKKGSLGLYGRRITNNFGNPSSVSGYTWDTASQKYASGIKSLKITVRDSETDAETTHEFDIVSASGKTSGRLKNGDQNVVYLNVTPLDSYGAIRIEFYVYDNCTLEIELSDFGDNVLRRTIQYGGIDTQAPETPTLEDMDEEGLFYTGDNADSSHVWSSASLLRMTLTTGENDKVISPNFYYIIVQNLSQNPYAPEKLTPKSWDSWEHKDDWKIDAVMNASSAESGLSISYNFETGTLTANGNPHEKGEGAKGTGMYLFRLYSFDMAGNALGSCTDFYINVDYIAPNYTATITFGEGGSITAKNAGAWATQDDVKLEIAPRLASGKTDEGEITYTDGFNISGNTLVFENDGKTYFVSTTATAPSKNNLQSNGSSVLGAVVFEGLKNEIGGTFKLTVTLDDDNTKFILKLQSEDGGADITPDMEWLSAFTLLAGHHDGSEKADDLDLDAGYYDRKWGQDGIRIRVDKTAPGEGGSNVTVNLSATEATELNYDADETNLDYSQLTSASAAERNWYFERYMGANVTLIDNMFYNYSDDYKVNFAVKAFENSAALNAFVAGDSIVSKYASITDKNAMAEGFDSFMLKNGGDFDGIELEVLSAATGIDLRFGGEKEQNYTAGVRLILVWVVDQAGNCSRLHAFYTFVDWTDYSLSAKLTSSELLAKNSAAVKLGNTTVKRGQNVGVTLSASEGYVPYKLSLGEKYPLLVNNGAELTGLQLANDSLEGLLSDYGVPGVDGNLDITYKFDKADFDDISTEERTLTFKHRQVVQYNASGFNRVTYKAEAVTAKDLTVVISNISDADLVNTVLGRFALTFVQAQDGQNLPLYEKRENTREGTTETGEALTDENGAPVPFAAVNVGDYHAFVYIPLDDDAFVAADIQFEEDGSQKLANEVEITVVPMSLYVVATEGRTQYGGKIELAYKLAKDAAGEEPYELAEGEGEVSGFLKLDGVSAWAAENNSYEGKLNAGVYRVVVNGDAFAINDNYSLTFVTDVRFVITQREVEVTLLAGTKVFGDPDPATFEFGVREDQFGAEELEAILAEIFGDRQKGENKSLAGKQYRVFKSFGISRNLGEDAGSYDFVQDVSGVSVNDNYLLKPVTVEGEEQKFTITQRTVKIAATGSSLLKYGEEFAQDTAKIGYRLVDAKDETDLVRKELAKLMAGDLLGLNGDAQSVSDIGEQYSTIVYYTVALGSEYDNKNIILELSAEGDDSKYYVYTAAQSVVIVSVKEDAVFELVYGEEWNGKTSLKFENSKFALTKDGEPQQGVVGGQRSVSWTLKIEGHNDGDYLTVGSYVVQITSFEIYNYAKKEDVKFVADNFVLTVKPAQVVIKPTVSAASREYGREDDSAYGFDFEIVSVNGKEIPEGGYAGKSADEIKALVKYGDSFVYQRAAFKDGTRNGAGSRLDGATNEAHLNAAGESYHPEVKGTLAIGDANFTLASQGEKELYLDITPYKLTLDLANFVGVSKDYDGTKQVYYAGNSALGDPNMGINLAYDLTLDMQFGDVVTLAFRAEYGELGNPQTAVATLKNITFANFSLAGEKAGNYAIAKLANSANNGAQAFGEAFAKDSERDITAQTLAELTIVISKIDNHIDGNSDINDNNIYIRPGAIGVWKSDITVSKTYDGTLGFTEKDVTVSNRLADPANSRSASPYLLSAATMSVVKNWEGSAYSEFGDADAGEQKYINLALFFTFDTISDISGVTIANGKEDYTEYADADVNVSVQTLNGRQGILVLIADFAATITKRKIDGSSFSSVKAIDRAYNSLDVVEISYELTDGAVVRNDDLGLTLAGKLKDGKDAGKHGVELTFDEKAVNSNYTVDIESVNKAFETLDVTISQAELIPNVTFLEREYNAKSEIGKEFYSIGEINFRTRLFNDELAEELALITFDVGKVTFNLSNAGKTFADVLIDPKTGAALMHSLLVSGIKLNVSDETKVDLKNYKLAYKCYLDGEEQEIEELTKGMDIPDMEITEAIMLVKAPLQIMDNNVHVRDKVYDGTLTASITVDLPQNMPEEDRGYLTIYATGQFRSRNVGENISVFILEGAAGLELTPLGKTEKPDVLNNYEIKYTTSDFRGNIVPRPVSVTVDLGEKTYDGNAQISSGNITYTFDDSMLYDDARNYNVQTKGGAFFDDKNVKSDEKGNADKKDGTVYNPELNDNKNTSGSNYKIVSLYEEEQSAMEALLYAVRYDDGSILLASEYLALKGAAATPDAFAAEDGEAAGDAPAQPAAQPVAFYYELPSSDRVIAYTESDKLAQAQADGGFVGYIEIDGVAYGLVTQEYGESHECVSSSIGKISYIRAIGKINKQAVSIPSNAVKIKPGSRAFAKEYDGTVKFFGVKDTDFTYDEKNLIGRKGEDDLKIVNLKGVFNSANTTASKVVFTGELDGADKDNYIFDENSFASVTAKISKRTIYARLNDGEMEYGTVVASVVGDIDYSFGEGNALIYSDGYFYIDYTKYLAVLGLNEKDDKEYVDELKKGYLYKENQNGGYEFTEDDSDTANLFIRLSGDFYSLPTAQARFALTTPDVGTTANRYYLSGGEAINFTFAYTYTSDRTSKLTVVPKDVYVAATSNDFTVEYGGSVPKGTNRIAFYDGNGNPYSFASGASYGSLFVKNGVDYGPVMSWKWYDTVLRIESTHKYLNVTKPGEAYVARFEAPEGVDYATGKAGNVTLNSAVKNYRFHFGHIEYDDVEGKYYIVYTSEIGADGSSAAPGEGDLEKNGDSFYRAVTSTMAIVDPVITGITVQDGLSFEYDGASKIANIVSGAQAGDTIQLVKGGDVISTVNAQSYTGYVKVLRKVAWDADDPGHEISYTTDVEYSLTITRKRPSLTVTDDSRMFNGKEYVYDYANGATRITGDVSITNGEADVSILKLIGNTYYAAYGTENGVVVPLLKDADGYYRLDARGSRIDWTGETQNYTIKDAGSYRVDISLNDTFMSHKHNNYEKITLSAYVTITRLKVVVKNLKIDNDAVTADRERDASGTYRFSGVYDPSVDYAGSVKYDVSVEYSGAATDLDESAIVTEANTKVSGLDNVASAGRYAFMIELSANGLDMANYSFEDARGMLELTQNSFSYANGVETDFDDTVDFIEESEKGIVANRLVVRHIKSTGGTITDLNLWNRVNSYMPYISKSARLAGIVQLQLFLDNMQVNTTGNKMEVSVKVPEGVDESLNNVVVYVKNEEGGLSKLTDYNLVNGSIVYVTEYLGEVVFVDVSTNTMPSWLLWTIVAASAIVAAFVIWVIVAYAIRKSKLKKLV